MDSLDVVRNELERNARAHLDLAQDLKLKLSQPLGEFIDSQTAVRKNVFLFISYLFVASKDYGTRSSTKNFPGAVRIEVSRSL